MITFVTIPKPFVGHISLIQKNAIKSWISNFPSCEVILFGDEEGISEFSKESTVRHLKIIEKNEFGTPLLSDAFKKVQIEAKNDIICYINTDIIMLPNRPLFDILQVINKLPNNNYLLVGHRTNLDIDFLIDYSDNIWTEMILSMAKSHGVLQPPCLIDYFIFQRGLIKEMPCFAVGRPGWDNWMIYNAKRERSAVVDVTRCITAIHQNHDYTHIPYGDGKTYNGIEAEKNRSVMKINQFLTIEDTDWSMTENGLIRRYNIMRRIHMFYRMLTEPFHNIYNHYHT